MKKTFSNVYKQDKKELTPNALVLHVTCFNFLEMFYSLGNYTWKPNFAKSNTLCRTYESLWLNRKILKL